MEQQNLIGNPFALLLNPEGVLAALQQSSALNRLRSRIWRPLDRSSGPIVAEEGPVDMDPEEHLPRVEE